LILLISFLIGVLVGALVPFRRRVGEGAGLLLLALAQRHQLGFGLLLFVQRQRHVRAWRRHVVHGRVGGRLLLFGIITAKQGELPFYDLYFKELALINARVAKSEDYPNSIALVQRGTVRLEPLVSHVMPLGQLKDAIGMLGSDNGQRMKIILEHA